VLYETIRNLNYHVPMWFAMITMLFVSFVFSNLYLVNGKQKFDRLAMSFVMVALMFGLLGLATGSFWARFTWLTFWTKDPKLNGAAIGVLMYVAYFILRSAIDDGDKRGRIASVFNTFAFPLFIVLIMVIPKMEGFSLHPGSGDTVGFSQYDLDNNLRKVFYPAVLGWVLVGTWLAILSSRINHLIKQAE
jgi:heme exporter protein C